MGPMKVHVVAFDVQPWVNTARLYGFNERLARLYNIGFHALYYETKNLKNFL